MTFTQVILKQFWFAKYQIIKLDANTHKQTEILTFTLARVNSHTQAKQMYLFQHGVTLKYVSPIEIVIIGGAQFKHMLNIGTVPLVGTYYHVADHSQHAFFSNSKQLTLCDRACIFIKYFLQR